MLSVKRKSLFDRCGTSPPSFRGDVQSQVLIYMSIRAIVTAWKTDGTLSVVQRDVETKAAARCVVAYQTVQQAFSGPWSSASEQDRYRTVKAIIDLFIDGEAMAVRVPPSKSARAQLALLDPTDDAVWEFRTRPGKKKGGHRYGVRVFGMFADKNLFVAMSPAFKEDLLDESDYPREIEFCKRQWRMLFPSYKPRLGDPPDAYLSNWHLS
jgi:hypothetical protein